jgi:hypothetical protein
VSVVGAVTVFCGVHQFLNEAVTIGHDRWPGRLVLGAANETINFRGLLDASAWILSLLGRRVAATGLRSLAVVGEQLGQIGQVHVAVAVKIAVVVRGAFGRPVVGEQLGQIGQIHVAVPVQVAGDPPQ